MSNFDPSQFLDATTTEASTARPPIPAGTELIGTILDINSVTWQGKQDPSKSGIRLDVKIQCDIPQELQANGQPPSLQFTDGIMLDITAAGAMDMSPGKNGKLRRYREALGMNVPGQAFAPRQMIGRAIRVKIKNEPYEGNIYDRVDSVAKV
jgi:hypothetical protein